MRNLILIILVLLVNTTFAQKDSSNNIKTKSERKDSLELKTTKNSLNNYNPREKRRLGVSGVIGGQSIFVSLSLDYFVTPNLNIEAGAGAVGGYIGMKYHLDSVMNDPRWNPYIGASFSVVEAFLDASELNNILYIPVGIQYIGNKGFSIAVEVAGLTPNSWTTTWGALRIGYHFKI